MGHGFKHGASGVPLNFKVVGGTTEPTNPKENMIWVNTDQKITEWAFAMANPYVHTSEELYTAVDSKAGYRLDSSGSEVADSNYTLLTDYIALPAGTYKVMITASSSTSTVTYHGFYDADGKLISTVSRQTGKATYDVPSGAVSIRISVRKDDPGSLFATYTTAKEGAVWFPTGTHSPVEFNALKQNDIQVYPLFAKQYISGTWADVTAKVYQDGEWKQMIPDIVLYDRGTKSVTFTKSGDGSFTENSNYLLLKTDGTAEATFDLFAAEPIDLTHYKTLAMEYSNYSSGWVCAAMVMNGEDVEARANASSSQTSGTATVDISTITGERKLKIRLYSSSATARSVRILSWKLLAT